MPKILQNSKGGTIIWDEQDWLSGFHPQYINSYSSNQKIGNQLAFARCFNPYRLMGYASPGFSAIDATNVAIIDNVILTGAVNGANAYCISGGAKMHKITLLTSALVNDSGGTGFPHTIAGTTPVGQDCIVYPIGTANYLFYTYNNSTQGQLGRNNFSTTFVDDYLTNASYLNKTAMTGTTTAPIPHPLFYSKYDGNLYIGDGRNIHALDGTTGTYGIWSASVFSVPQGYIITSFAEVSNYLVIFAYESSSSDLYYKGNAFAFFWDYFSGKATKIINLDDNYVVGAFNYKNTIGCFTYGRTTDLANSRNAKVRLFDEKKFEILCSYIGNPPVNGGVDVQGDVIYWGASNASVISVWSYGSPFKGFSAVLNCIGEGLGNTAGICKILAGNQQLLSSGTTTSGGLQVLSSNYAYQAGVATSLAEPIFSENTKAKVKNVKVFFATISSGGLNITIQLKSREGNMSEVISNGDNLTTITSSNMVSKYIRDYKGNPFINFDALKAIVTWGSGIAATDAPVISRIEVNYELISI